MIKINRPTLSDISLVSSFFSRLLQENFPMFNSEVQVAYGHNWQSDRLLARLGNEKELLYIAWEKDQPIGLIAGTAPEGGVGTIIWLITDRKHRGKKIGLQLLEQGREHYRQLNCHKIKLTAPSEAARDFYLKNGMTQEGFHKTHWYGLDFWALGEHLNPDT